MGAPGGRRRRDRKAIRAERVSRVTSLWCESSRFSGPPVTQHSDHEPDPLLDRLSLIASRAGAAILAVRDPAGSRRIKSDSSPVTEADEAAEALILEELRRFMP